MTASNAMTPPTVPPTIGAVLEDEFAPAELWFKEGEGTLETTVDDGGEVDVTMTWVITTWPFDRVVVEEEDIGADVGVGVSLDDAEVDGRAWDVKMLLLLLLDGAELQEVENKVRVGFDVVNVTGTVIVTGTEIVDVEAGRGLVSYDGTSPRACLRTRTSNKNG